MYRYRLHGLTSALAGLAVLAGGAPAVGTAMGTHLRVGHKEAVGAYLTDGSGRSLYLFEHDEKSRSTCYDACASVWLPVLAEDTPVADDGVEADKLSTIERKDGSRQVTYAGWPYRFVKDDDPGDTYGQDVDGFGGEWYLVSPEGKQAGENEGRGDGTREQSSSW